MVIFRFCYFMFCLHILFFFIIFRLLYKMSFYDFYQ